MGQGSWEAETFSSRDQFPMEKLQPAPGSTLGWENLWQIMVGLNPAAWHVLVYFSKADTPTTTPPASWAQEKEYTFNFSARRSYIHSWTQAVLSAVHQLGCHGTGLLKILDKAKATLIGKGRIHSWFDKTLNFWELGIEFI